MKKNTTIWIVAGIIALVIFGSMDPAEYSFPLCPMRYLTGWLCPGCGSQRAVHQILHFQFGEAIRLNFLILPALLYGFVSVAIPLLFPNYWLTIRNHFYGLKASYLALTIIILFWIGRNLI